MTDPLLIFLQASFVALYLLVARILLGAVWSDWRNKRRVWWQGVGAFVAESVLLIAWMR